jgi:dipeptidyl-peptidase-4
MKKLVFSILLSGLLLNVNAQQGLELADFVSRPVFQAETPGKIVPLNDGKHYARLEEDGTKIVKYSFTSPKPVGVLVDVSSLKGASIESIEGFTFSPDGSRALVYNNSNRIYRRSFIADYYVIDIERREVEPLSKNGPQRDATFAPNGYSVAFVRDNNIFIKNLRFGTENQITFDGAKDTIINGAADWVYEEEFAFTRAFDWSADSQELAYIKFDESQVKQWTLQYYKGSYPEYKEYELYPGEYTYKYPKAGTANSVVSVHVFNIQNRTTKKMDIKGDDIYIPRIQWTNEPGQLAIVMLNRRQDQLDLLLANSSSGLTRSIMTDRNSRYVSEDCIKGIYFLPDGKHFVYKAQLDGYFHLHLYSLDGRKVRQLTKGNWDVTDYYGYDAASRLFYFQAAARSPLRREVYSVNFDGTKMTPVAAKEGTNKATFSSDFSYYVHEFSSASQVPVYQVLDKKGKLQYVINDNNYLKAKLASYKLPNKEFFTFRTEDGVELNGWMIKPLDFDQNRKYPVLMVQYGGPDSQEVLDMWEMGWEYYLAMKNYLVVCVDGRGTAARGEEFSKQTYMKLGRLESDDQISTARYLSQQSYVDANNIAIWGWSYGGFISTLCLSRSDLFKAGIAIAPPLNHKFYDTAYTERFMRKPAENPSGYAFSPIEMAENLHGRLLLVHGTVDDNVHIQHTYEFVDKLVQAGKQFDLFIYPNRNHFIRGGNTRLHLYQMKFDFLERNLKN